MTGARRAWRGLPVVLALAACGGGERPAVQVRDSAGVEIVESHRPRWAEGSERGWRLADAPALDIGVVDGAPAYQLDEVADVLRLEDGRIVVADAGSGEIRFFDADGAFLGSRGGPGDGPGEFQLIHALGRHADSVWVYDFPHRRFTVFPDDRGPPRVASLAAAQALSPLLAVGRAPGGDWVLAESWSTAALAPPPAGSGGQGSGRQTPDAPREGLRRDPVAYVRFEPGGALEDTVAVVLGREVELRVEGGSGGEGRVMMVTPPFARTHTFAMAGDRLFIGDQVAMEIREFDAAGTLRRLVRIPEWDLTLTETEIRAAMDRAIESTPERFRPGTRRLWEEATMPETKPAYGRFVVDHEGNLWVGAYARPPAEPTGWTVFDRRGRWLGRVEVPERFRIHHVDAAGALGVWWDELDVEHVRLYPVRRIGS